MSDNAETAILAGGCCWGSRSCCATAMESSPAGSASPVGSTTTRPTLNHPGHAEAVEVVFDPGAHLLGGILEFFFRIHDPTTKHRQGEDVGSDYRFEIFYTSDDQRQVAEDTIADVDASGLWPSKVVAEISEAGTFWEAEAEDQYYLQRHPDGETCHFPRPGWKLPHRETAA
jgi:peptide-methionine (S)-S-oxide reductase